MTANRIDSCHSGRIPNGHQGLSSNLLTSLAKDQQGNLWIGTEDQGLNEFEPATNHYTRFSFDEKDPRSISGDYVRDVLVDSRQQVWAATYEAGLDLLDRAKGTFTHFRHNENDPSSLGGDKLVSLFEDSRHRIWIGANGNGLDRIDNDRADSRQDHGQRPPLNFSISSTNPARTTASPAIPFSP